jgi:rubredoxin
MNEDYKPTTTAKLGGAKRKNGHKANCSCHICENMKNKAKRGGYQEDAEKEQLKLSGGSKKKNGHKPNCACPICKNMKNAKKGGDEKPYDDTDSKNDLGITGGKKSNGHKANCTCPICKNMKKKNKKGGDDDNDESDIVVMSSKPDQTTSTGTTSTEATTGKVVTASDNEYDEIDAVENGKGGTRKRRSNGHKATCKCPICKNMKKKTRRHKKRSHRRR